MIVVSRRLVLKAMEKIEAGSPLTIAYGMPSAHRCVDGL